MVDVKVGGGGYFKYWYQLSCKNREVKGHYQLFVKGELEGRRPRPVSTPEIIPNAVTCAVWTASHFTDWGGETCQLQLTFKVLAGCHLLNKF